MTTNNKRIFKNTLFLYFRMFLVMGVSLFTSRVILRNLGIEDFGIYNVVAGVVSMMAFLNSSMATASQRFIIFALGKKDYEMLNKVFSISLILSFLLFFILLILGETIGLWWVNNKLVLSEDRLASANWIFQFSIISCGLSFFVIPYNATIIAHEKMSYYAYLSIIEACLKLGVAYVIAIVKFDKLVSYGCLMMFVQGLILGAYRLYCRRNFEETRFQFCKDSTIFKKLLSFSGWSLLGSVTMVIKGQGLNMLLNSFFGPVVNAARGIAYQLNSIVLHFFTNFYTAVKPQITKNYAAGNNEDMVKLLFRSAKFSFFLILFLSLPLMIETRQIISLWLGKDIEYVVPFTRLIILITVMDAMATPLMTLAQATGKIALYHSVVSFVTLLILPFSYVALRYFDCSPIIVFAISLCASVINMFARLFLVNRVVRIPVFKYIFDVYLRCSAIAVLASILPIFIYRNIPDDLWGLALVIISSLISSLVVVWFAGLSSNERKVVTNKIKGLFLVQSAI